MLLTKTQLPLQPYKNSISGFLVELIWYQSTNQPWLPLTLHLLKFLQSLITPLVQIKLHLLPLTNAHHFLSIKLTNTNYLYWKTQMVPYHHGQRLLGYVNGSNRCPPSKISQDHEEIDNPAYDAWIDQDQTLMSLLIASLSEEVLPLVVGLTRSNEIWQSLEAALASPSHTHILQLHL